RCWARASRSGCGTRRDGRANGRTARSSSTGLRAEGSAFPGENRVSTRGNAAGPLGHKPGRPWRRPPPTAIQPAPRARRHPAPAAALGELALGADEMGRAEARTEIRAEMTAALGVVQAEAVRFAARVRRAESRLLALETKIRESDRRHVIERANAELWGMMRV